MHLEYLYSKKFEVPVYLHFGGTAFHCVTNNCFSSSVPDPCHFGTDPDPRIRTKDLRIRILLFSSAIKIPTNKQNFLRCFAFYFLKVHLFTFFLKKRSLQGVAKQQKSRFFLLFLLDYRRSRIRIQRCSWSYPVSKLEQQHSCLPTWCSHTFYMPFSSLFVFFFTLSNYIFFILLFTRMPTFPFSAEDELEL